MKESKFFEMCDKMEEKMEQNTFDPEIERDIPTVEALSAHNPLEDLDTYLPLLLFLSQDPYKDRDLPNKESYNATVKYCKELLYKIDLED